MVVTRRGTGAVLRKQSHSPQQLARLGFIRRARALKFSFDQVQARLGLADQWQRYIKEKMSRALSRQSAWFLFGLSFIVVYREVFETILFYAALWTEGNGGMMLAGAGSAVVLLGLIAWVMLRYSRDLPIAKFFAYSAWLMGSLPSFSPVRACRRYRKPASSTSRRLAAA